MSPEAVRQHLLSMGYRWKRTRYAPSREPDPEEERRAREELEELKRPLCVSSRSRNLTLQEVRV